MSPEDPAARVARYRALLDDYLMGDLRTMLDVKEPTGLGYPMLQTILAGMELVGGLLSGKKMGAARDAFLRELERDNPRYNEAVRNAFGVMRNTTAHTFLVHTDVWVRKDGRCHLTKHGDHGLTVDLKTLLDDFEGTYRRLMDEMADGTRSAQGLRTLDRSLRYGRSRIKSLVRTLGECPPDVSRSENLGPPARPGGAGPSGTVLPSGTERLRPLVPDQGGSATILPELTPYEE